MLEPHQIEKILTLSNSDHPRMVLIATPLTGSNFLNWSRSVRRALAAQSKLELIDGTLLEPTPETSYYKQWIRTDAMISSWIINSISKELSSGFTHIPNTRKLWEASVHRFGRCNGPRIYKLQREIFGYVQGNQSVVQYFNSLTGLWDELDMILPPLDCNCIARKKADKREEQQRLMKFLHGLNYNFEQARSQILLLEPLTSVDRAYAMIVQAEDELSLNRDQGDDHNMIAMNVNESSYGQNPVFIVGGKGNQFKRRLTKEERKKLRCRHCHETGHEIDECFKLHGVSEW